MTESPQAAARRFSSAKIDEGFKPEALHEYQDQHGKVVYHRIRLKHPNGDKWIRPLRTNGTGYELRDPQWPPAGKPLYRLPEIIAHPDEPVWLVEGEWCADSLARLGVVVTTSGAADSASRADWSPLKGRIVTIWPDNDAPGMRYAQHCIAALREIGATVDVIDVAKLGLPEGGDAVDWLEQHPDGDVYQLPLTKIPSDAKPIGIRYRRAIDIEARPIRWLWPDRIARGKASMVAGNPGIGKSQITASMAAIVSTGGTWPVDRTTCERGNVVILSAEDDAADTIRPRLEAAGADLSRVIILDGIVRRADGQGRGLTLRQDLAELGAVLNEIGDVALIVIDPISAYLGDTDSHKNAEIRGLLAPLSDLAAKHSAAVVCVSHLNKGAANEAMMRVTGSLAFVAAARAAYLVAKDKDDDTRRLFLPLKNNVGDDRTGLAYELRAAQVDSPAGAIKTCQVIWHSEPVTVTADDVMRPDVTEADKPRDAAKEWLQDVLGNGPIGTTQMQAMTREAGFAWATVRRAKDELGIKPSKTRFDGGWEWALPKVLTESEDAHTNTVSTLGDGEHLRADRDTCLACDGEGCDWCRKG